MLLSALTPEERTALYMAVSRAYTRNDKLWQFQIARKCYANHDLASIAGDLVDVMNEVNAADAAYAAARHA